MGEISGMKNSIKNTFPLDGKTVFHQPEKQFLLGAKKFFFKNWPPHFDNGFH